MRPAPLLLDFRPRSRSGGVLGIGLLLVGLAGACASGVSFEAQNSRRAGLELKLDALTAAHERRVSASDVARAEEAAPLVRELAVPWSMLLAELEAASQELNGRVAVLAVEPDRDKGRLKVVAESKDLNTALSYIERLQRSRALRFPMLDSHEVRTDDHEQPVRFQLTAEWRNGP